MHRCAVVAGGKLDTADQLEARLPGYRNSRFIPFESVMVGDGEGIESGRNRSADEFLGTCSAIGEIRVGMKVDQILNLMILLVRVR
jgi:hypothetical protein